MNSIQTPLAHTPTSKTKVRFWSPYLLLFVFVWAIVYFLIIPDPLQTFRQNYDFIAVGFLGAIIGNMTALGGGLVFIPVLIFAYHVPPVLALKTSIISQALGMTSGAIAWTQSRKVPWHLVPWAVPGLIIGSTFSSLVVHPNAMLVKGFFGPVSMLLGCLLLVTLVRKIRADKPEPTHAVFKASIFLAALVGGVITGWVAIGEGELVAATLMLFFGLRTERAIALGVALLAINSLFLAFIHTAILGGVPWNIAMFTGLGCVFGARLAPFLSCYVNQNKLKLTFATVAILDGLLFLSQFYLWSHH